MEESNKRLIIAGVSFLLGAAAGGTGMFFYSKRYFKAKADNEMKEMADYYNNKYADDILAKKEGKENDREVEEEGNDEEQTKEEYGKKASIYETKSGEEKPPVAYNNCFGDSNSGDITGSDIPKKKKGRKKKVDIEVVDQEVWDENPGGLDSRFLVYYDADSVLVDEESEIRLEDDIADKIIKVIDDNDANVINDTLILQDNKNNCLLHVTVEQMAYSEVGLDD